MSDESFPINDRNRIKRAHKRGHYDKDTIYRIIDSSGFAHIAYAIDSDPFCTPTCHWREGDFLYWHGSSASRMIRHLKTGVSASVTVSHLDGFVIARSSFHHSVNYRSAMCFGTAHTIENDDEKRHALHAMINRFFPGRTHLLREIKPQELKATAIIKMKIENAAAKIRDSGVADDEEDYNNPVWAGVIPLTTTIGKFQPDERLEHGITPSQDLEFWKPGNILGDTLIKAQHFYEKTLAPKK